MVSQKKVVGKGFAPELIEVVERFNPSCIPMSSWEHIHLPRNIPRVALYS